MVAHQRVNRPNSSQRRARSGWCRPRNRTGRHRCTKAAHLHTGHHLNVGQQLFPAGMVVAQPDAAVPVAANDAGTAVQQGAPAGRRSAKASPAARVMLPPYRLCTRSCRTCCPASRGRSWRSRQGCSSGPWHRPLPCRRTLPAPSCLFTQLCHAVQKCPEPLRGVEQRGFVHVVPEALNTAVGQHLVAVAEPVPHFRA